ncbi:MAG: dTMP kinase [bacterium]|nr:dTMP kinase [bacterium]
MKGAFITFEGIDKSGKSTQAETLLARLRASGREVVFTREPGGTELGREIRHLVLNREEAPAPVTEMLLFAADRGEHVETLVRPALASGKIVICDRYIDSTIAYQGYGLNIDREKLQTIQEIATGGLQPDLTVLVDIDIETARARGLGKDADRLEKASDAFFNRVRTGYLELCQKDPVRIMRVDGTQKVEELSNQIYKEIQNRKYIK